MHNPFAFLEKMKIGEDATSYDVYSPPKTMAYLLLGPEGAYTDWHVDFAGSSVWYHVVKGKKVFMAAPDTEHNIRQFLNWSSSDDQNDFLGERLEKCVRLELNEGDTMFLPGGWFHAVSTPEDSVVVGGNYINPLRLKQLLTVRKIERQLDISSQAEYPKFDMLMYYAAGDFIKRCQQSRERGGRMQKAIVTKLEAKGLESLAAYLESVVDQLESSLRGGRLTKEKRALIENVERCKGEVLLITSFLRCELDWLKSVYSCDGTDVEEDPSFSEEVGFRDISLSRARRRVRCSSDDGHGDDDDDDLEVLDHDDEGESHHRNSGGGEESQGADHGTGECFNIHNVSNDLESAPPSDKSFEKHRSIRIHPSTSNEESSEGAERMVGTKARDRRILSDSDDGSNNADNGKEAEGIAGRRRT